MDVDDREMSRAARGPPRSRTAPRAADTRSGVATITASTTSLRSPALMVNVPAPERRDRPDGDRPAPSRRLRRRALGLRWRRAARRGAPWTNRCRRRRSGPGARPGRPSSRDPSEASRADTLSVGRAIRFQRRSMARLALALSGEPVAEGDVVEGGSSGSSRPSASAGRPRRTRSRDGKVAVAGERAGKVQAARAGPSA